MRPRNNRLREFVRLDARGMDIAGTNIYQQKPPHGKFREITPQGCCAPFQLLYTPAGVAATSFTVTVKCGVTTIATLLVSQTTATVTIQDVVELLYRQAKSIGRFAVEGSQILLQLNKNIAQNCATASTLSFTVA